MFAYVDFVKRVEVTEIAESGMANTPRKMNTKAVQTVGNMLENTILLHSSDSSQGLELTIANNPYRIRAWALPVGPHKSSKLLSETQSRDHCKHSRRCQKYARRLRGEISKSLQSFWIQWDKVRKIFPLEKSPRQKIVE